MIELVCKGGQANGIPVRICGEMASDPFHVPLLLGLGLRSMSMTARSIPVVKRMIRRIELEACVSFAREALTMATALEVEEALTERLQKWAPELFGGV